MRETTKALEARIAELERERENLTVRYEASQGALRELLIEHRKTCDQLAQAREDTVRLDWLEGDPEGVIITHALSPGDDVSGDDEYRVVGMNSGGDASTLRAAIDAARETQGEDE